MSTIAADYSTETISDKRHCVWFKEESDCNLNNEMHCFLVAKRVPTLTSLHAMHVNPEDT